jgi:hypothetical protein
VLLRRQRTLWWTLLPQPSNLLLKPLLRTRSAAARREGRAAAGEAFTTLYPQITAERKLLELLLFPKHFFEDSHSFFLIWLCMHHFNFRSKFSSSAWSTGALLH